MVLLLWESVWYLWEFWIQFYVLIHFLFPFSTASFSLSLSLTHSLLANTSALIPVMQNLLHSYYNLIFLLFLHYFILILALFTFSDNFKYTLCYSKTRCSLSYPLYHRSIYYYYYHHCNSSFKFFSVSKWMAVCGETFSSYVIIIFMHTTWLIITSVH